MDALELLKEDHRKVSALFEQAFTSESIKKRRLIFGTIKNDLETHAFIEETVFYPAFERYDELKEIVDRSFREHHEVRALMQEMDAMGDNLDSAAGARFDEKLHQLQQSVGQHVSEEESRLFPAVRKLMKRPERERLGRHMQAARDEHDLVA